MHRVYGSKMGGYSRASDANTFIEYKWTCSNCGKQGGMSVCIDHCPECLHLRCNDCPMESVKRGIFERIIDINRLYAPCTDTSYKWSSHHQVQPGSPSRTSIDTAMSKIRAEEGKRISGRGSILNLKALRRDPATPDSGKPFEPIKSTSTAYDEELVITTSNETPRTETRSLEYTGAMSPPKPFQIDFSTLSSGNKKDFSGRSPGSSWSPDTSSFSTEFSQTPSDTFTSGALSVESQSDVETSTEGSDSEDDRVDEFANENVDLHWAFGALEDSLMSLLGNHLSLVARILPRAHDLLIQSRAIVSNTAFIQHGVTATGLLPGRTENLSVSVGRPSSQQVIMVGFDEQEMHSPGSSWDQHRTQTQNNPENKQSKGYSTAGARYDHHGSVSKQNKRDRSPDEPDKPGGSSNAKRPRQRFQKGNVTFACHFHKHNPEKYGPWTDRKYRGCVAPSVPERRVSRIKDHFKAAHRTPQCDRCYLSFEDSGSLVAHSQQRTPCDQRPKHLKEGINQGEWELIDKVLKDKRKHDIQKWWDIWDILFTGLGRPATPWNEPQVESNNSPTPDLNSFMSSLGAIMQSSIPQGVLQPDYQTFMDAVRQAFVEATTTRADAPRIQAVSQRRPVGDHPAESELLQYKQDQSRDERDSQESSSNRVLSTPPEGDNANGQIKEQEARNSNFSLSTANYSSLERQTWNEELEPLLSAPAIPTASNSTLHPTNPVNPEQPPLDENMEDWSGFANLMDDGTNYYFDDGLLPQEFNLFDDTVLFPVFDCGDYGQALDANNNSLSSLLEGELTPDIAEEMTDAKKNVGKNRAQAFRDIDDD